MRPYAEWSKNELNGYPDGDPVPPYRAKQVAGRVRRTFSGPMNLWWQGAEIPSGAVPEKWRETLCTVEFTSSVAEYESLTASDDGSFRVPWPTDSPSYLGRVYQGLTCVAAWREISRGALVHIIDQVRTRVLTFALEIEAQDPTAGETPATRSPVNGQGRARRRSSTQRFTATSATSQPVGQ